MNLAIKYLPSIFLFHACACGSVKFETSWRCGKTLCQLALVGKSGTRKYIIPIGTYNVCWSSDILVKLFNNLFYCFVFSAQIPYKNALCKRQSLQSIITFEFTSILWRNWPQAPSSSNQSYQLHWFHLLPPMDCLKYTQYPWSVCTCVSRFQFHVLRWKCYLNISCLAMIADHLPGLEKRTSNDQCTKWKSSFLIPAMDFSVDLGKKTV